MPSHLSIIVLSYSKRNLNRFVIRIDGFHSIKVYHQDTDSLYRKVKKVVMLEII